MSDAVDKLFAKNVGIYINVENKFQECIRCAYHRCEVTEKHQ